MERVSTIRRRPRLTVSGMHSPDEVRQNMGPEKSEPIKSFKENGQATISVKLDYLPEVKYSEGKKEVLLPIRTPQLGFLQFFLKAKTYRRYRKMILELDEEQDYYVIIKAPHLRLEKRSGTPTCYGCEVQIKLIKKRASQAGL